MGLPTDLVSLAQAKAWAGDLSASDVVIAGLISQVSGQIRTSLNRARITPYAFNEIRDGIGSPRMMLRNYPVISVSSVIADHRLIPAANPPGLVGGTPSFPNYGYLLESWDGAPPGQPQWIDLFGTYFSPGRQNAVIAYTAGYQVTNEPQAASIEPVTVSQPYGTWATDQGVTYVSSGIALSMVPAAPAVGQYSVYDGAYAFSAADAGQGVLISYGFIPTDLANAAAMWVAELLQYQSRVGVRSKSIGGNESVTYETGAMPGRVAMAIQPYRKVAMP